MNADGNIFIDTASLPEKKSKFPKEDFVNAQFDVDFGARTTDVLVILSTPRSGSTFLCDYLYQNKICIAHEYFQMPGYLPILADRWDCIAEGKLSKQAYIEKLQKFRTLANGWLGINLHGSHIAGYLQLENKIQSSRRHYIYLQRRDLVAQAISFEIAVQTKQWSTHFEAKNVASYNYKGIRDKMRTIEHGNLKIQAFLESTGVQCTTIFYEDLIKSPREALSVVPCLERENLYPPVGNTKKQFSKRNKQWIRLFRKEQRAESDITHRSKKSIFRRIIAKIKPIN